MKIRLGNAQGTLIETSNEVTLFQVFSGVGIQTDMGLFGIAQRDAGIEVMLEGKTVWTSHAITNEDVSLQNVVAALCSVLELSAADVERNGIIGCIFDIDRAAKRKHEEIKTLKAQLEVATKEKRLYENQEDDGWDQMPLDQAVSDTKLIEVGSRRYGGDVRRLRSVAVALYRAGIGKEIWSAEKEKTNAVAGIDTPEAAFRRGQETARKDAIDFVNRSWTDETSFTSTLIGGLGAACTQSGYKPPAQVEPELTVEECKRQIQKLKLLLETACEQRDEIIKTLPERQQADARDLANRIHSERWP